MNNHTSAANAQNSTRQALNVTNVALMALAVVVAIMLLLDLLLLKPVTNPAAVIRSATPATSMAAPTSDY